MSRIEKESLVQGRTNPRRRDGSVYPLYESPNSELKRPWSHSTKGDDQAMTNKRARRDKGLDSSIRRRKKNWMEEEPNNKKGDKNFNSKKTNTDEGSLDAKTEKESTFAAYLDFKKKYNSIYQFDYGDTEIHGASGIASMWAQHKLLFGNDCGDTCPCINSLPRLGLYVISDHRVKQAKKGRPIPDEKALIPRGVFDYFAPRFVPLLRQEYPLETASRIINRLVDMWPFHQGSRRFGIHCSKNCDCDDHWDQLFGKGDKQKTEEFLLSSRKRQSCNAGNVPSANTQSVSSPLGTSKPTMLLIPRSQKSVVGANSNLSAKLTPEIDNFVLNIKKPVPKALGRDRKGKSWISLKSLCNKLTNFEVSFDPSYPLGGYFRTENGQNGILKCRIFSKFSKGQLAKDPRITVGTAVAAVVIGDTRHDIAGHLELKMFYDHVRGSKNRLSLLFETQAVKTGRFCDNCWSANGAWVGAVNDGWAGCSQEMQELNNQTLLLPEIAVESFKPVESVGQDDGMMEIELSASEVAGWTELAQKSIALGKSSLRKQEALGTTTKKKLAFSSRDPDVYLFDKDAPVNQSIVLVSTAGLKQPQLLPSSLLIEADGTKIHKEPIVVPYNRVNHDRVVVATTLGSLYQGVAESLKLPVLENPKWVKAPFSKMCRRSNQCPFLALGNCRYWHVLSPACPNHYGLISLPPRHSTLISESTIRLWREHGYWTSAYLNYERKIVVYAQGGPPSCMVSNQGVSWYPSKPDALYALKCTLVLLSVIM